MQEMNEAEAAYRPLYDAAGPGDPMSRARKAFKRAEHMLSFFEIIRRRLEAAGDDRAIMMADALIDQALDDYAEAGAAFARAEG